MRVLSERGETVGKSEDDLKHRSKPDTEGRREDEVLGFSKATNLYQTIFTAVP